jgi:hypothetical protein
VSDNVVSTGRVTYVNMPSMERQENYLDFKWARSVAACNELIAPA